MLQQIKPLRFDTTWLLSIHNLTDAATSLRRFDLF